MKSKASDFFIGLYEEQMGSLTCTDGISVEIDLDIWHLAVICRVSS